MTDFRTAGKGDDRKVYPIGKSSKTYKQDFGEREYVIPLENGYMSAKADNEVLAYDMMRIKYGEEAIAGKTPSDVITYEVFANSAPGDILGDFEFNEGSENDGGAMYVIARDSAHAAKIFESVHGKDGQLNSVTLEHDIDETKAEYVVLWDYKSREHSAKSQARKQVAQQRAADAIYTDKMYTHRYHGVIVKDYGWKRVLKKLTKQNPDITIMDDSPISAPESRNIGTTHNVQVWSDSNIRAKQEYTAIYDPMDKAWFFFTKESGNRVNIKHELKGMTSKHANKWYVVNMDREAVETFPTREQAEGYAKASTGAGRAERRAAGFKRFGTPAKHASLDTKPTLYVVRQDKLKEYGFDDVEA